MPGVFPDLARHHLVGVGMGYSFRSMVYPNRLTGPWVAPSHRTLWTLGTSPSFGPCLGDTILMALF